MRSAMSYFQRFYFLFFSFLVSCFRKTLHSWSDVFWIVLFLSILFMYFLLPRNWFFFAKRCISGVLHSGMSYFQSFHFSIFSFPEAFFRKTLHFRRFRNWDVLFSRVYFFGFLIIKKFFSQNAAFSGVSELGCFFYKSFFFCVFVY